MMAKEKHGVRAPSSGPGFKTKLLATGNLLIRKYDVSSNGEKESLGTKMPRMSHRHTRHWVPRSVTESMHS